jgi:hypothetical protein
MAAPCSFKKSSSLFFTADAIVDLLQKLIDIAAVADAIQDKIAEIGAVDSRRAACVFVRAFVAVREGVARVASITPILTENRVLSENLAQQRPPLQPVCKKVSQVIPAPDAIF